MHEDAQGRLPGSGRRVIGALAALLGFQLLGELLVRGLGLPVPGPVIGMVLLFAGLLLRHERGAPEPLAQAAGGLLNNLGLLFIPAGVGVVLYLPLLVQHWAPILLAIVVGTVAAVAVTGWLAQALLRGGGG